LAIAAVLLLYIVGLVVAVPLGRVAVAVTLMLAFVVAVFVGGRLGNMPVPPGRGPNGRR
jgi:FlaG/FlaF family flagellin (archaellin)